MATTRSSRKLWLTWGTATLALAGLFGAGLTIASLSDNPLRASLRSLFLPGKTTSGHYQIENACEVCHTSAFGGREVMQDACVKCHGAELKEAEDSHPKSKFTDPRNADVAAKLDAAYCVTCHVEHRPQITGPAGFTLPADTCRICHQGVAKDRPTHKGFKFDTCTSSGCHNFHDNRALYEDFLLKHAHEPDRLEKAQLPARDFLEKIPELSDYPSDAYPLKALSAADADAQAQLPSKPQVVADWLGTAHAQAGVNCSACHTHKDAAGKTAWVEHPPQEVCAVCHGHESQGFLAGKHGMRLAQHLDPMRPSMARLPMRAQAHDKTLGCTTCHGAHRFDTRRAAVESCLGCHDDGHSRAYKASSHYALWQRELKGELPRGSGVTCATCHLPRIDYRTPDYVKRVLVQHNQNDSLDPNDKMIRPACLNCHGLGFSLDALADPRLIANNFQGKPTVHIESIEMAEQADARAKASIEPR
jgi:hypothetical protein